MDAAKTSPKASPPKGVRAVCLPVNAGIPREDKPFPSLKGLRPGFPRAWKRRIGILSCVAAQAAASPRAEVLIPAGGGPGWVAVCRTDASVTFAPHHRRAELATSPIDGQPVSMWRAFPAVHLQEDGWIEVAATLRLPEGNTNAALRDIRLALAHDNGQALSNATSNLAIPYSGYYATASSRTPGGAAHIAYVDGSDSPRNFFSSPDGAIETAAAGATVDGQYRTLAFRITRRGADAVFSASLDGEGYGEYTLADAAAGTLRNQFSFNAAGLAYANQLGQSLLCDRIAVRQGMDRRFRVDDYYEAGDGADTGPAIRRAVAAAQAHAAQDVTCSSHVWFEPDATYPLAERTGVRPQIELYGAERIRLAGNNARLVSHINNNHFALWRCKEVEIDGFRLDLSPLPFTQGAVVAMDLAEGSVDIAIDPGFSDPPLGPYLAGGGAPDAPFFHADGRHKQVWVRIAEGIRPAGAPAGVFRMVLQPDFAPSLANVSLGDRLAVKTLTDHPIPNLNASYRFTDDGEWISSGAGNIEMRKCANVAVRNLESHASRAQTFHVFGCRDLLFENAGYRPMPGSGRLLASNKGGLILRSSLGNIRVRDCWFESAADDLMNASDHALEVVALHAQNLVEVLDDRYPMEQAAGWNLLVVDPSVPALKGTVRVAAVEKLDGKRFRLSLGPAVFEPGHGALSPGDAFYVERQGPVFVQGSTFVNSMKKGIISRGPTRVSGSLFQDLQYGIHHYFRPGDGEAGEGPCAYGLQAEGNLFVDIVTGGVVCWMPGTAPFNVHQGNVVSSNRFEQAAPGHGVQLVRMNGVEVVGNEFAFDPAVDPKWRAISHSACTNLVVSGNSGDRLP